jgi:glycosyltransferase involved in cell wall biosynthesis
MKVLLISPFSKPDVGGVESHIEKLTTYLQGLPAVEVVLLTYMPLTSNERPPRYEKKGSLETIRVRWFGKGWFRKLEPYFPLNMFYLFPGLFWGCLKLFISGKHKFDVIHAHGFIAGAITKVITGIWPVRSVISTHAIYSLKNGTFKASLFRWLLRGFDEILAVGEPSLIELESIGIPRSKLRVHPNWIRVNDFDPSYRKEIREKYGIRADEFVVLFVGRMIEIKGELLVLEAARRITGNIRFVFVGTGPTGKVIQEEAKANNRILFLGRIPDSDVKRIYNIADVFASPVLYDEGFATVYLEALASGVPVLTVKRGCLPYFLSPDVATFLDVATPGAVEEEIRRAWDNKMSWDRKSLDCRAFAEKNFSEKNAEIIYERYLSP